MINIFSHAELKIFPYEQSENGSLISALFAMRGLDESSVGSWISADLDALLDLNNIPLSHDEMCARDIFLQVMSKKGAKVIVYGDYDVDGIASTAIAVELCSLHGASVRYFIPHRFKQGYGFHASVAEKIAAAGCDLLIIADCGTNDAQAVEKITAAGIPCLIFDHHAVSGSLAQCSAVVNHHSAQSPHSSPMTELCAASVLWCWAYRAQIAPAAWLKERLDIIAMATLADCMSLANPLNRTIATWGMGILKNKPRSGLGALFAKLDINPRDIDEEALNMKVIPCLNAAGRLDYAEEAVRLLLKESPYDIAEKLVALNKKRQNISSSIITEIEGRGTSYHVYSGDWPVGVLSGVASRLCSARKRPLALISHCKDELRGTLRIPNGATHSAVDILSGMSGELIKFGGHRYAAGFSVSAENCSKVETMLEERLKNIQIENEPLNVLKINIDELTLELHATLDAIRPFGAQNPAPLFYIETKKFTVAPMGSTGKAFLVSPQGCKAKIVAFDKERVLDSVTACSGLIFKAQIDNWNGNRRLKFYLEGVC